jgi:hypothetical protein
MRDFANEDREELYDLWDDPDELVNLADSDKPEHRAVRQKLSRKILDQMKRLDDPALN